MSSTSLHHLPKNRTNLPRQCYYVITTVTRPRQYTIHAGKRAVAVIPLRFNNSSKLTKTKLVTKAQSFPSLSESSSRFFQPLPRQPERRLFNRRQHRASKWYEQLSDPEQEWIDIETASRKQAFMHKMRLIEQNEHTGLLEEDCAMEDALRIFRHDERDFSAQIESLEKKLKEINRPNDTEKVIKSLQDLVSRQEEIHCKLELSSSGLKRKPKSLMSVAIQSVKRVASNICRKVSSLNDAFPKDSGPVGEQYKPSKWEMRAAIFCAACYFGYMHSFGPLVREALIALSILDTAPSAQQLLGFFIHTLALPLIFATPQGMKGVIRCMKSSNMFGGFFSGGQRRHLTKSRTKQSPGKETAYRDLVDNHPELLDTPFPMAAVLDDLRNLQALRGSTSGREYKVAERRLFRVQHESEIGEGGPLTVRQVTQLLQPDDRVGWTTIRQRLLENRFDAIDNLSKQDRARMMFSRVYGVGQTKAQRFVNAGFLTLEQLREACLERAQRIGLEHIHDIECLIPGNESEEWREILLDEVVEVRIPLPGNPEKRHAQPKAKYLMESIIDELLHRDLLIDTLSQEPIAVKGIIRLPYARAKACRIDLNFVPYTRRAF
ncbi:related to DNA polymerase X - putative [Melanopsichium pennsylvanicum]|uniref:Related to DNA polymerase X - putative n=1 Tax=Melanopsichium pennsylvanicum TaxID=63383 RepID=A0AAJ5C3L1_9BASI|nr:related to DNA polymerase X - putative [Melanopsichium pennsylvanicum]